MASNKSPKASPAAEELAQEKGVDLDQVEGSGDEGKITKPDVAEHAEEQRDELQGVEIRSFYAVLNPNHPGLALNTAGVDIGGRFFGPGEENVNNIVSDLDWDYLSSARTSDYPNLQILVKGREVR